MSNPILKNLLIDEINKCKQAGMKQHEILAYICSDEVVHRVNNQVKIKVVK